MLCEDIVIEIAGRKIVIDESIIKILNEYVRTAMGLDELAKRLGLDGWEQAYEFVKKIPAWVMWISPTYYMIERKKCKKTSPET
ncbi:MAG: hypothetical protein ABWJ42_02680 [Sulfolobales archaeon]